MKREHLGQIDSTNDEARRRADSGEKGPIWLSAKSQTKGRGRRGREWESKEGNLYTTGLYSLAVGAKQAANISFIAALAVKATISHYLKGHTIEVKWPNDVLVDGAKIAGILLESWLNDGEIKVAIGIGINIVHAPEIAEYNAVSLAKIMKNPKTVPSAEDVLIVLCDAFESLLAQWNKSGFAPIREKWLACAKGVGTRIGVRLHDKELFGVFKSLNEAGELLLELDNGNIEIISAGDVFFPHLK